MKDPYEDPGYLCYLIKKADGEKKLNSFLDAEAMRIVDFPLKNERAIEIEATMDPISPFFILYKVNIKLDDLDSKKRIKKRKYITFPWYKSRKIYKTIEKIQEAMDPW